MKTINYTLVWICLLIAGLSFGQSPTKAIRAEAPTTTCVDFEIGGNGALYHAGWHGQNAIAEFDLPSMDNTHYRKGTAIPGGPSYLYNSLYEKVFSNYIDECLCFDYKVFYDGLPDATININPTIIIFDGEYPHTSSVRAEFVANITVTENSDWVHVCAPIQFSNGSTLPDNDHGQWTNVTAAQWDALLTNIGGVAFKVDVGGPASKEAIIGIDNVCVQDCTPFVDDGGEGEDEDEDEDEDGETGYSQDGAYCCDGENLVTDGNFENNDGTAAFITMYDNNSALNPGQFQITSSAAAFGADIKDHSYCADSSLYPNNNRFMIVNGKTQQQGSSTIWAQTISGLTAGKTYRFCANFKNMPQCTFDILPEVDMYVSGVGSSGSSTISADPTNPCDWINKEFVFTATSGSATFSISLDETGNGDGNDLAIDDISVSELVDPELSITVQHQGNPQQITASINTISTSDDQVPGGDKCEFYWFTAKVNSFPPLDVDMNTLASGNYGGNDTGNGNSPWSLTTTFPGYNFDPNSMYIVGMYMPECGCNGEGFTYQLTYNNRPVGDEMLSEDQKQQIIDIILNGRPSGELGTTSNRNISDQGLSVYPNPSRGNFNLSLKGDTLKNVEIFSVTGQPVFTQTFAEGKAKDEIDISSFSTGIYIITAQGADGKQYNAKILKE